MLRGWLFWFTGAITGASSRVRHALGLVRTLSHTQLRRSVAHEQQRRTLSHTQARRTLTYGE